MSLPVIIYVLGRLDHGGGEIRSLQLFEAIKARYPALQIVVYSISADAGSLEEQFRRTSARIVYGRVGIKGLLDFWLACRRHNADVLHANVGAFGGYLAVVACLAGVKKRICHFRSTSEERIGFVSRLKGRAGLLLMHLFRTEFVGVCAAARSYSRVAARRWMTIYNGVACAEPAVALHARHTVKRDGFKNLLVLGRISPEKHYTRPVRILESLIQRRDGDPMKLHFVGSGEASHLDLLNQRIAASPMSSSITLHGLSDEPLEHLRRADMLLLTSLREGMPGVVLEALSVGTPVVASDLPGVREIASAVEGLKLVPTGAPDRIWCEAILATLRENRAEAIIRSFARGPFRLGPHVTRIADLWGLPRLSHEDQAQAHGPIQSTAGQTAELAARGDNCAPRRHRNKYRRLPA